jgi:hypothetical protein
MEAGTLLLHDYACDCGSTNARMVRGKHDKVSLDKKAKREDTRLDRGGPLHATRSAEWRRSDAGSKEQQDEGTNELVGLLECTEVSDASVHDLLCPLRDVGVDELVTSKRLLGGLQCTLSN